MTGGFRHQVSLAEELTTRSLGRKVLSCSRKKPRLTRRRRKRDLVHWQRMRNPDTSLAAPCKRGSSPGGRGLVGYPFALTLKPSASSQCATCCHQRESVPGSRRRQQGFASLSDVVSLCAPNRWSACRSQFLRASSKLVLSQGGCCRQRMNDRNHPIAGRDRLRSGSS